MIRPYSDNVILQLEPPPKETASGIALVHTRAAGAREHRFARVIASGPGFKRPCCGAFVPNETKPGDRVIVDALAGQNYDMDLHAPRFNKSAEFHELFGERADFRIAREEEVLAIVEEDARVAAE